MNDEILHFMKKRLDKNYYEKFSFAFNSGKRIRPRLMKNICDYLKKDFRPLLPAAAAIEVMHCMSLAHDDIVDKAVTRRLFIRNTEQILQCFLGIFLRSLLLKSLLKITQERFILNF